MSCPEPEGCLPVPGRCDEEDLIGGGQVGVRMLEYRSMIVREMVRERLGCSPSELSR